MIRRRYIPLVASIMLACAPLARAADAPTPITADQEAAFLKPYITADTFVVAHVDVDLVDTAALEKFVTDALASVSTDNNDAAQHISQARLMADAFLGRFKQVGGRHVYMVVYQHGEDEPQPPIFLFPLESGGNPKALAALLTTVPQMQSAQISDSLVALGIPHDAPTSEPADQAASEIQQKLKDLTPADRPEFAQGLSHANGALQVVLAPGQSARDALAKNVPTLPPPLGGGSSDVVTKDLKYAMLSVSPPPNAAVHMVFQSDSPEAAQATLNMVNGYFKMMQTMGRSADYGAILSPHVAGNAVEIALDDKQLQSAAVAILPEIFTARRRAESVQSSANMRQDLMGAMMYANENNDAWPTDLKTIVDKGYLGNDRTLTNPNDPKHRPYEYHPFTKDEMKKLDPSFTPVLWEVTDNDSESLNVGYLDGHVERLSGKAELNKQLEAAQAKLKNP